MGPNVGDIRFDSLVNSYQVWNGYEWVITDRNAVQTGTLYYSDNTSGLSIGNSIVTSLFEVQTTKGRIIADMETGIVEFPPGMHRSAALCEFWQGFAQIYRPNHSEIALAKQETQILRDQVKDAHRTVSRKITEKIQAKYGNEKFIMIKPDDLINFIKGD